MGPVGGRKGEGRLSRTIIRDGGMSLGLIEEIRGHQGKKTVVRLMFCMCVHF